MVIGDKIRELREARSFSQGEIERRTGLFSCYTSRVENGHTVPTIETLEKYAHALEVPLYAFFYEEGAPPAKIQLPGDDKLWGAKGKEEAELRRFVRTLGKMKQEDRKLLFSVAARMAQKKPHTRAK
jgi:transcriptional regulator with XRE-family HTH domain